MQKTKQKTIVLKLVLATVFAVVLGAGLALFSVYNEIRNMAPVTEPVITDSNEKGAVKILFIGNSLTFVNMLPVTIAEFIKDGLHKPTKIYQVCVPGETLSGHWKTGVAQRAIAERGPWDFVVLQGASLEPLYNQQRSLAEYAKRFDVMIKAAHAKTILFETWADKADGKTQQDITAVYHDLGAQVSAPVIPIGESFFYAAGRDTKLVLYSGDNHHPGPAGTYLAACIFYSYMFNKDPHGLPSKIVFHDMAKKKDYLLIDLDPRQSAELQDFAWSYHKEFPQMKIPGTAVQKQL